MTRNHKFSALFAILVVGFLSIYANVMVFNTSNVTNQQIGVTLNMQSGAQIPLNLAPGQVVPTQINGDQVTGAAINGQMVPMGANAIVSSPNGNIQVMWQMCGGQAGGVQLSMPDPWEAS
ncbi:MAG TPA: hypothetical protein VGM92_06945 [Candidatus Kapabacteria bacterium]